MKIINSIGIKKKFTSLLLAGAALIAGNQGAEAFELNITYDEGTTIDQIRAFETAKEVFETLITDQIDVNIHVQAADPEYFPNDTTLALAIPAIEYNYEIHNAANGYLRDLQNNNYGIEIAARPWLAPEFYADGQYGDEYHNSQEWSGCNNPNYFALGMLQDHTNLIEDPDNPDPYLRERRAVTPFFDENQSGDATTYNLLSTTAQLKALESWHKLDAAKSSRLDGLIVVNNLKGVINPNTGARLRWASWFGSRNTDNSRPFKNNHFNLTSVAMHEIGHILGFFSGGDLINSVAESRDADLRSRQVTFLDFFRRDSSGQINLDYGSPLKPAIYVGAIHNGRIYGDLSSEEDFIISGLSRGIHQNIGGDGWQNSHFDQEISSLSEWWSLPTSRKNYLRENDDLMSPGLMTNWRRGISPQDAIVFDILGYEVDYAAYKARTVGDYTRKGVDRANQIVNGELPGIITNSRIKQKIDDQKLVLAATLVDAVLGEYPSFDENMDSYETDIVQDALQAGLEGQELANFVTSVGDGLAIRRLRSLSRASGLRTEFLRSGGNLPATLQQTLLLENPDGSRIDDFSLQQKGILFNEGLFADQGEFEQYQEDNSNDNIER